LPGSTDPLTAGNGSLMRLAPVPLAFRQNIALLFTMPARVPVSPMLHLGGRSKSAYSSGTRIVENSSRDAKRDPIPIKRAGIQNMETRARADLRFRVIVEVPTRLNSERRRKLEEFAAHAATVTVRCIRSRRSMPLLFRRIGACCAGWAIERALVSFVLLPGIRPGLLASLTSPRRDCRDC
jgi:hypothetical protein